jgi:kynureninase
MIFNTSKKFAEEMDVKDPLRSYQDSFYIPTQTSGERHIYLCGNSLGLQPKNTRDFIDQELKDWQNLGVEGHFYAKNPWLPYHEFLSESYSRIIGAKTSEVVAMNTLSVNLHLMFVSFYQPNKERFKIVIENDAFPSDIYAVESHLKHHNLDPKDVLIKMKPRVGEDVLRTEDILELLSNEGDSIALVMFGGVNYYTGQVFDFAEITKSCNERGVKVGFDLAHAAGNISLSLHDWGVDFAVWCSYKYLNSGPGSIGGAFIHEKHHRSNLNRFAGWWGHNKETRFKMPEKFDPIQSAEGWQLSNPPILSLAAIRASLSIFDKVGMKSLLKKSQQLTSYLVFLIDNISSDRISIITPNKRGCQISIRVRNANKNLFKQITDKGVVADWREPDVIRVAPVPLYNSYMDVYNFYKILEEEL